MITLLTPSKTMDFATPPPDFVNAEMPHFLNDARYVREVLSGLSEDEIMQEMHVSQDIARRVVEMYDDNSQQKAALWTYVGDVYKGFQARSLDKAAAEFAQRHLLIPSAVYGLVQPYDLIAPYRLEMKAKIAVDGQSLAKYWGARSAGYLSQRNELNNELCVLSSQEYAKAIIAQLPNDIRIVTPIFMDKKPNGTIGQVPIYSKMMRGVMARWIVDHRIDSVDGLPEFSAQEYYYAPELSTLDTPAFYREKMTPLRFLQ